MSIARWKQTEPYRTSVLDADAVDTELDAKWRQQVEDANQLIQNHDAGTRFFRGLFYAVTIMATVGWLWLLWRWAQR